MTKQIFKFYIDGTLNSLLITALHDRGASLNNYGKNDALTFYADLADSIQGQIDEKGFFNLFQNEFFGIKTCIEKKIHYLSMANAVENKNLIHNYTLLLLSLSSQFKKQFQDDPEDADSRK